MRRFQRSRSRSVRVRSSRSCVFSRSLARDRLVAFAGLLALVLTALGMGGVTAYQVTRLHPELAVRVAPGSTRGRLVGLVLSRVLRRLVGGVAVGLGLGLGASRMLESLWFGVEPRDPVVFAGAAVALTVVGLFAGWVPAYRASRLNPARALTDS